MKLLDSSDFSYDFDERKAAIAVEKARVWQLIAKFHVGARPLEGREAEAVELFLRESFHVEDAVDEVTKCRMGATIMLAPDKERCAILLAILKELAEAPLEAYSMAANVFGNLRFVHDYYWGALIRAILRSKPAVDEDFIEKLLHALAALAPRFDSNYPCNTYEYPFKELVRFLDKKIPMFEPRRFFRDIVALYSAIREAIKGDLVERKGCSKAEAEKLAQDLGKWLKKPDRNALAKIESWLGETAQHRGD